jgi:hypothetical protein
MAGKPATIANEVQSDAELTWSQVTAKPAGPLLGGYERGRHVAIGYETVRSPSDSLARSTTGPTSRHGAVDSRTVQPLAVQPARG